MDEEMAETTIKIPGERLGSSTQFASGCGTYIRNGFIYSKLCGVKEIKEATENSIPTIEIRSKKLQNIVPGVNSVALCKVLNNNARFCKLLILSVNGVSLRGTFNGIIRIEDVRATEKDKVKMYECFSPGDIVLARILSLGDSHSYFLSTSENELGVIYAVSNSGHPMIPVSWCTMKCSVTGSRESRKVAKVKTRQIKD